MHKMSPFYPFRCPEDHSGYAAHHNNHKDSIDKMAKRMVSLPVQLRQTYRKYFMKIQYLF